MSELFSAMNGATTRTWNGMPTLDTSENAAVDLFFKWGAARGKFKEIVAPLLAAAVATDLDVAVRLILWGRDVRSGAGERQLFKDSINFLAENEMITVEDARRILAKIPELGRWDDLEIFVGTVLENEALTLWVGAIRSGNGLAAKWAPRKGELANKLRRTAGLSPKDYRKLVVTNTNVVETFMCAKEWDGINFSHVPSVAASRYQKAFNRNAPGAYSSWKEALVKKEDPKVKVNASAIYPYDVIKSLRNGDTTVSNEQWKALPDFMAGSENVRIMPMVDVSGSMDTPAPGQKSSSYWDRSGVITCMDVAISLGLYISERNRGVFKDEFLTFSSEPQLLKVKGSLRDRWDQMRTSKWQMNTDLVGAFRTMLAQARKHNVSPDEMPTTILVISDMQFDSAVRHTGKDERAMDAVKREYRDAGYATPNVVWWNVNSTGTGVPVRHDERGTALVSGFSPSIMKSVLRADEMTPTAMMLRTVMDDRYAW